LSRVFFDGSRGDGQSGFWCHAHSENFLLIETMVHCAGLGIRGGVEHYDTMMNQAQVGDERKTSRVFFKISTKLASHRYRALKKCNLPTSFIASGIYRYTCLPVCFTHHHNHDFLQHQFCFSLAKTCTIPCFCFNVALLFLATRKARHQDNSKVQGRRIGGKPFQWEM